MQGYDASTYGEHWAANYDQWTVTSGIAASTAAAVAGLTQLLEDIGHPSGPALELGIGTGRVALPLADRGVAIHGIDSSPAMVQRLRAKPGGADIPVEVSDFADVAVDATFPLVFAVFNTFFALLDQESQVRCFAAVAEHLTPGGVFTLETFVPDPARFTDGQRVAVGNLDVDSAALEVSLHDPVRQQVRSHHLQVGADGVRLMPVVIRYAWPSELDLMAQLAACSCAIGGGVGAGRRSRRQAASRSPCTTSHEPERATATRARHGRVIATSRATTLAHPTASVRSICMAVIKTIDLVGVSTDSWRDAAHQALDEANRTLRNIEGFDVLETSAIVRDGQIAEYHTHVRIKFRIQR